MNFDHKPDLQRRAFLRRGSQLALAGSAAPWALNLSLIGDAAAATAPTDYKALVCVFLYGGNDYGNTLPPVDATRYAAYSKIRQTLALPAAELAATTLSPTVALADGMQYALAPGLQPLKPLFDQKRMAVLLNVGTLLEPTTLAQYKARTVKLPPNLFSHNDQQSTWQSSNPEGASSGWGGRMGDVMLQANGSSVFTCVSVTGNAVFVSGTQAVQYQIGSSGAVAISGITRPLFGSSAAQSALRSIITQPRSHLFESAYGAVTQRSVDAESRVTAALAGLPALTTSFDTTNSLAMQLRMVARLIQARDTLGPKRQVFMVSLGGFDTHSDMTDRHAPLMTSVGAALSSFQQAMDEIGTANQVTAFTASDFGRTLSSNGDGADHGWGSHHFVLGGAVKGGRYYGTPPAVAVDGPDDVGQGRLLPTTAVDQLAATLATWFGISASELPLVLPNIGRFSSANLGFV